MVQNSPEVSKVVQGAQFTFATLIEIKDPDSDYVLRLTPYFEDSNVPIRYQGNDYAPIAMRFNGTAYKTNGPEARPEFTLSLIGNGLSREIFSRNNFIGFEFIRTAIVPNFGSNSVQDSAGAIAVDSYIIESKTGQDATNVRFGLASALDQEGVVLPRRDITQNECSRAYRVWDPETNTFNYVGVSCPFRGTQNFTRRNDETTDPSKDSCERSLRACKLRFPGEQGLPIHAFPGIERS